MLGYMNRNREYFEHVDGETYQVLRAFLHSERMLKEIGDSKMEGEINMCPSDAIKKYTGVTDQEILLAKDRIGGTVDR